ncbi:hypothetical protein [uncultured Methanomethylovorans sp.]|uniref:hypothetical protein n=1 Tax=uncultured Methanomethylovorans sp. TaxID=183759 RepID=UPI002AA87112|nr:hypothetical protein [uncultured Methanomethylovorans sp.]
MPIHATNENKPFVEFAEIFKKENAETLHNWLTHGDPVRKAMAKTIMEATA